MKFKIKDPGSAITHFYRMCYGRYRSGAFTYQGSQRAGKHIHDRNERIYPEYDPALCGKHYLPHGRFYREGKPASEKNGSYDDLYPDRRKLYTCMPDHSGGTDRIYPLRGSMGGGDRGHYCESLLDHLSQMVFFGDLYRYGMAVCIRLCTYCKSLFAGRVRLASGRRTDLYHWWCDLCVEASDL